MKRNWLILLLLAAGCEGLIGPSYQAKTPEQVPPGEKPPGGMIPMQPVDPMQPIDPMNPPVNPQVPDPSALFLDAAFGTSGLRRLTRSEVRASLTAIFDVDPAGLLDTLPQDSSEVTPFDNDFTAQGVSVSLIQGVNSFAESYAVRVTSASNSILAQAGCTPSSADDAACFEAIVRTIGRRALRRPLSDADVAQFSGFLAFADEEQRFDSAVELLIRALVQMPEFLYRVETGTQIAPGVIALNDYAVASRISFFVSGSAPEPGLLDAAEAGELRTPAGRRTMALELMQTPAARAQWQRFHAMWLGYEGASLPPALAADLQQETDRLIDRIILDADRWLDLFTSSETFVTPALAEHYGMAAPSEPAWVAYEGLRGGGILAHGTFLTQGSKFGDTSPTLRGASLVDRVLCQELGAPPPNVDVDNPPPGPPGACKPERYTMRDNPSCSACHGLTDNIGFGLENLSASGEWRESEPEQPACAIDGRGSLLGTAFTGPRELGSLFAASSVVESCATQQLFRFAVGRPESIDDRQTIAAMRAQMMLTPKLQDLILAMVESQGIATRRE